VLEALNGKIMNAYDELKRLELELVSPDTRRNPERLSELLSDSFEEYGSSGAVFRKSEILENFQQAEPVSYDLSDFTFLDLAPGCILVKYRSTESGQQALRSSIWRAGSGQWQMLHHQSTVVPNVI
jgi:hypothetical protein